MVERDESQLTDVLKAASDPTRRAVLTLLAQHGPTRVTELAARFDMSLNAVSKHIKVLEAAGLVSRRTIWREHLIELHVEPLTQIDLWFRDLRSIWDLRLDALDNIFTEETAMTTTVAEDLTLTLSRHIAAPPEKVYAAWLTPETLMRFMGNCQGMSLAAAHTDPRVGGAFQIDIDNGSSVVPHTGTYLALQPHSKIAFTWVSPYSTAENSTVTLDLIPDGSGTQLTLTHSRFIDERHRDMHVGGWSTMLDGLARTDL